MKNSRNLNLYNFKLAIIVNKSLLINMTHDNIFKTKFKVYACFRSECCRFKFLIFFQEFFLPTGRKRPSIIDNFYSFINCYEKCHHLTGNAKTYYCKSKYELYCQHML